LEYGLLRSIACYTSISKPFEHLFFSFATALASVVSWRSLLFLGLYTYQDVRFALFLPLRGTACASI
jgi:hypothetical protein